jgi:hypothetical protein
MGMTSAPPGGGPRDHAESSLFRVTGEGADGEENVRRGRCDRAWSTIQGRPGARFALGEYLYRRDRYEEAEAIPILKEVIEVRGPDDPDNEDVKWVHHVAICESWL